MPRLTDHEGGRNKELLKMFTCRLATSYLYVKKSFRRAGNRQQIVILCCICALIGALQVINLYRIKTQQSQPLRPQPHQKIILPQDIALPDSLDINMIRKYREWKLKDSTVTENIK